MLSRCRKAVEMASKAFAIFNGLVLIAAALLTGVDVVSSAFFGKPIPATIELTVLVLPWVICGGLSYALVRKIHVRVTLITGRLGYKARRINDFIANLGGLIFCVLLTIGGALHFWSSWKINEPMFAALMTLPAWLGKLAIPVGFLLLAINFLFEMLTRSPRE